ncbi:acylphosphatase (macronuclear) [Tetrahymena thermophila SB210]|uniref:acylphosphatase n=1 Tax=Tetrahymena thermophila (strain SB210) TaxID=312017 RepID=A4VEH0_TETTS|nr:acylphosphatase [Tetrahymena thermophila SB210]EDK31926.2 acylphosphatase [Tetrahymena thermophila SB210]|eukprot:XP_001470739.2 acylphosphatase [Tetrahymena thermophila SB210]
MFQKIVLIPILLIISEGILGQYNKNISENMDQAASKLLISFEYVVHGKVQGVFFRKYTKEQADKLGLKGWVMNTPHNTVVGAVQGPVEKAKQMEIWLSTKGSPKSNITKFEKKNEKNINSYTFNDFEIRK